MVRHHADAIARRSCPGQFQKLSFARKGGLNAFWTNYNVEIVAGGGAYLPHHSENFTDDLRILIAKSADALFQFGEGRKVVVQAALQQPSRVRVLRWHCAILT